MTTAPRHARRRRRFLQAVGGSLAAATLPAGAAQSALAEREATDTTEQLSAYMLHARDRVLPAGVLRDTRHRVLDTLAAIVSGAQLPPGIMAIRFARAQGGVPESSVLATDLRTSAVQAALANGMCAHADETDDAEPTTKTHPGSAVVPAALAVAEREDRSGMEFLRAVALGYDLCVRFVRALDANTVRGAHRAAESYGGSMGAVAAAASLLRLDQTAMRYALSYAAQQASGIYCWGRDPEHIEKAFDFSGQSARNGVTAALMASMGFTGVRDVFDGEHNVLDALSSTPRRSEMTAELGQRFFVSETTIKQFSVGLPMQAALDALVTLKAEHQFTADSVLGIVVTLPEDGARVVDNRDMPDVNIQYILAVTLIDGTLTFDASHSFERMRDPAVLAVKKRIRLIGDRALMVPDAPRSARVEVTLRNGRTLRRFVRHPPGFKENPLDERRINEKAQRLIAPVLGERRTATLIDAVNTLDTVPSVRDLLRLMTA